MSHFSLLVITDQKPTEADLEVLLAPYQEREDNDQSKWDWFQIGGRWTGKLDPTYDPKKDPRNVETCNLCAGTGKRDDDVGRGQRAVNPNYTCNGCDGTGRRIKWPTQWAKGPGNQLQVKDLRPDAQLDFFAYLRDGRWMEKGEMGWWAVVSKAAEPEVWEANKAKLKSELKPEQWLTVVDCHI